MYVNRKFRCGVAPIRIETGRYEYLAEILRLCPFCIVLENKIHVILNCQVYSDPREQLLNKAMNYNLNLYPLPQFVFQFSSPELVRIKTCREDTF